MTVPPDERPAWPPVGGEAPDPPLDFDPYRFGRPDQPVPPEYAPPGYRPPAGPPTQPTQPSQPGQYAYSAPYYPGPPPHRAGNTKAVIALILGILSVVLFWTSIYDLVLVVPAIVLGALGRRDATRDPRRGGKGMATAGLVCGIVAVVLAVVATVFVYTRIKSCLNDYDPTSSAFQSCARAKIMGD